ncbi:hypothetical protein NQ317_016458 [Molorchus minor]|uniref:Conserved oligomeric Golgi complex subunit 6 n=1 Tax=Molorchus minor TaxID=1323400 RepID=A0ABQ9JZU6_9CUCU|nr:hypothetical protein NQ317_016458 [Molorchus minor]
MIVEQTHVLSKRLNKVLEARFENEQETLDALKQLSTFYVENTLQARRNLRSQIEKRSLGINKQFLSSFLEVKESFDSVYDDIEEMNKSIKEMTQRLQSSKVKTKQLLAQTNSLQQEKSKNRIKQDISQSFIEHFQLSPNSLLPLYEKKDLSLSCDVFMILDKVQNIHNDCKVLMQSGFQSLALDIMEQMTLNQEKALENLYRWSQSHCKNMDNPDIADLVSKAMARLQDRTVLFGLGMSLMSIVFTKKTILVGEFINALTRGGPSGNPAPIEMRAHDIQIYVTDMLVWLNKAIPIEKQNFSVLIKLCNNVDSDELMTEAMAGITEGIVKRGLLQETLTELQNRCEQLFFVSLQQQVNNMLIKVESPPRNLSPTPVISNLVQTLRDMLSTSSLCEGREIDMGKIADIILEPLLRAMNEQASHLPPIDMAVYMLNCIYEIYTCLSLYEFMDDRLERLQAQAEAQIDTLTSEQTSSLVANLNLGPIYTILQDQTQEPLSGIPGMQFGDLKPFLVKLNYLTTSPDAILLTQIKLLTSSKHKKCVQKRSFEVLIAIYKQLYEAINNPTNQYENPHLIFERSPEELENIILKSC